MHMFICLFYLVHMYLLFICYGDSIVGDVCVGVR